MSVRLVLDASAALRVVMGLDDDARLAGCLESAAVVIAPGLYVSEVANALRRYVQSGDLDLAAAVDRLQEALELLDDLVPDRELGVESLAEAARSGHSAYDMMYAVLARRTASLLLSRDARLLQLLPRLGVAPALAD